MLEARYAYLDPDLPNDKQTNHKPSQQSIVRRIEESHVDFLNVILRLRDRICYVLLPRYYRDNAIRHDDRISGVTSYLVIKSFRTGPYLYI
jgi:hypothetical protein